MDHEGDDCTVPRCWACMILAQCRWGDTQREGLDPEDWYTELRFQGGPRNIP